MAVPMNRQTREGFDHAATAAARVAARVLYDQFKPKAPTFTAIAEIAQAFHDSTVRALQTIGVSDVAPYLEQAIERWQVSVVTELQRLYRPESVH
jgi:hypothetical protein